MREEVFILCTGSSLNNLTEEEKNYVRSKKHICVNRYPLFWQMIGIEPRNYILVDNYNAEPVIQNVIKNTSVLNVITTVENKSIFLKYKPEGNLITATGTNRNRKKFIDKITPESFLFWCSVLGSAVNASTILFPDHDIKILGMDGGMTKHYWTGQIQKSKLDHSSINKKHSSTNMLKWGLPIMNRECNKRNIDLSCCNINSEWVQKNLIKYSPVIPS